MPRPITLPLSTLLACGPLSPSADITSTTEQTTATTTATTTTLPDPTTSIPATTITPTSTAVSTSTSEPTSSGTTLADDFITTPDGGHTGPFQCDTWAQDCPSGQKCTFWAKGGGNVWNATKCVDVTGNGAPGDPCTAPDGGVAGIDDCALGAMCWDVDQTNHGTCIALCTGLPEAPICPPMTSCRIFSDGISICISICDPLLQDCPDDDLCITDADGTSFTCVLDASGDLGKTNDPCEFANACDKGLMCLDSATASSACDPESTGCCQPFCKFPGSPCPNPDQQCVQFFDPMTAPPGYESVGICAIPS